MPLQVQNVLNRPEAQRLQLHNVYSTTVSKWASFSHLHHVGVQKSENVLLDNGCHGGWHGYQVDCIAP